MSGEEIEWAIAEIEARPVRNYETRVITGYMISAAEWRKIRAALRRARVPSMSEGEGT